MSNLLLLCFERDIGSWKYIVFAMGGVSKEVKLYVNGKPCASKKATDANIDEDSEWKLDDLAKFLFSSGAGNIGVSMMDDLSFYKNFPVSDAEVHNYYLKLKFG